MTDAAQIAAGLTDARAKALRDLGKDWQSGPSLPDHILDEITPLRMSGLVERKFGDTGPPVRGGNELQITIRLSACWYFRPTDAGLAVRDYLMENG